MEITDISSLKEESEMIKKEDIYADLLLRGYEYGENYNCIDGLSSSCSNGTLTWNKDWTLLLEGLFQVHIFSNSNKNILMPHTIQKIVIDMDKFTKERNGTGKSIFFLFYPLQIFIHTEYFYMYYELHFFSTTDEVRQTDQCDKLPRNSCEWCHI